MGALSISHIIVVVLVVVLLFGRNKVSQIMGDIAGGIRNFKRGIQELDK